MREVKLIFILAIGRSGTTLLQSIINAHSACLVPMETLMVPHLFYKYRSIKSWSKEIAEGFVSDLSLEYQYQRHWVKDDLRQSRLLKTLTELVNVPTFEDLIKLTLLNEAENPSNIALVGIKTPRHSLLLNMLTEAFPNALYIHLIRDPRASIASHIKSLDYFNLPLLAVKWSIDNRMIKALRSEIASQFYYLRYEDLVQDSEEQARFLCQFLGIPFDPEMLSFYKEVKSQREQGHPFLMHEHHQNLMKPVSSDSIEKWTIELSEDNVHLIEAYCKAEMKENKYNLVNSEIETVFISIWHAVYFLWRVGLRAYFRMPMNFRIWLLNLRLKKAGLEPLRRNLSA